MSELSSDLRLLIEQQIDLYLKSPSALADTKQNLAIMGIEPNLETTLSFITGTILGTVMGMWLVKKKTKGKKHTQQEAATFLVEARDLLSRRAMELRQHFIKEEYM